MKDPNKEYVYRATVTLPNNTKINATFIAEDCCNSVENTDVLEYVYNKYFELQPDISMYQIKKVYTVMAYLNILSLANIAMCRAEMNLN